MSSLLSQFQQKMNHHRQPQSRLILALSGGVDSRVLLDLLAQYRAIHPQVECFAVHVHHGLSGNADDWAMQCQTWGKENNIPVFIERVKLDMASGDSIEQMARDARYQSLAKHIAHGDLLLTGQHSDDQLETFLLALKRGSGPKGLSSMPEIMPLAQGSMLRPLLHVSRHDIESYASEHNLDWVEDESNQDKRFDRNFIRHDISPALIHRWPNIKQAVQRSASLCAEQESLLDELLTPIFNGMLGPEGQLSIEKLTTQSELSRNRLIRMWFSHAGQPMPSRDQLTSIWQQVALAQSDAAPQFICSHKIIRRFQQHLYFIDDYQDLSNFSQSLSCDKACHLPDGLGTITLAMNASDPLTCWSGKIDRKALNHPLEIHFNPEGLVAHPNGRGHSRKVKKLFQEYSIPPWQRKRLPVVMCGDQVVAIVGLFIDKQYAGQDLEIQWYK
ncbi:tRNA lysidine(34) synthetase TilS [Vibrio sp. 10N.286.49.B3]|uniref:tRNA lysidine(34) synthetase TilS n=1 Tax=Vibrio sp. 10N.286.49.B3 TaxID=1880855 RepID=UPI000C8681F2|nr:tRNA lysidine(34) synthetase TilS [Vibrio sp. 10N.286.49.B3]PMH41086.1 tRNA lysidine(34) synthetase TilS [Vibrio sp. 10N.286.49.B3]